MDQAMYETLRKAEGFWWYQGRLEAVKSIMAKFDIRQGKVLDLGAGFGGMYTLLSHYGTVTAFEIDPNCIKVCKAKGYDSVIDSKDDLFHTSQSYDLIAAFDVLEHIEYDQKYLIDLHKIISKNGFLVATVPAHPFLWGKHDIDAHHFRRHTKRSLRDLVEKGSFKVCYLGYWNCSLFLPAAFVRLLGIAGNKTLYPNPMINTFLKGILHLESKFLSFTRLPIGLSLVVVAQKL